MIPLITGRGPLRRLLPPLLRANAGRRPATTLKGVWLRALKAQQEMLLLDTCSETVNGKKLVPVLNWKISIILRKVFLDIHKYM